MWQHLENIGLALSYDFCEEKTITKVQHTITRKLQWITMLQSKLPKRENQMEGGLG